MMFPIQNETDLYNPSGKVVTCVLSYVTNLEATLAMRLQDFPCMISTL